MTHQKPCMKCLNSQWMRLGWRVCLNCQLQQSKAEAEKWKRRFEWLTEQGNSIFRWSPDAYIATAGRDEYISGTPESAVDKAIAAGDWGGQ